MSEDLRLLEQRDKTELAWLRPAAKEGFEAIERGDSVNYRSDREIAAFVRKAKAEGSAPLVAS